MTNKDYELDSASAECTSEEDFLSFIDERESNAEWLEANISSMNVDVRSAYSPDGGISENARNESAYYVSSPQLGDYYLRDIAVPSLLERARISGYALSDVSREDFAEIVSKCLAAARQNDTAKVRLQDSKAAAFMASSYKIVPQPEIFKTTATHIRSEYDGEFIKGAWNHMMSLAEYNASLPVSDYEDIFKSKGMNFSEIVMTLSVITSDTGYSGVNIFPAVVGIMPGGRRFKVPILGEICMNHKGRASINEYDSNLSLAFAQTEKTKERIKELDSVSLNYPFNAFCNILKKVGIGKKQASGVLDQFAVTIGNDAPATAADVYFKACEIAFDIDQKDTMLLMALEENISKILKLSDKSWSEFDRALNCWSYNI